MIYPKPRGRRRDRWSFLHLKEMLSWVEMATFLSQRETPPYEHPEVLYMEEKDKGFGSVFDLQHDIFIPKVTTGKSTRKKIIYFKRKTQERESFSVEFCSACTFQKVAVKRFWLLKEFKGGRSLISGKSTIYSLHFIDNVNKTIEGKHVCFIFKNSYFMLIQFPFYVVIVRQVHSLPHKFKKMFSVWFVKINFVYITKSAIKHVHLFILLKVGLNLWGLFVYLKWTISCIIIITKKCCIYLKLQ